MLSPLLVQGGYLSHRRFIFCFLGSVLLELAVSQVTLTANNQYVIFWGWHIKGVEYATPKYAFLT